MEGIRAGWNKALRTIYYCCWNERQPRNRIMLLAGPLDHGPQLFGFRPLNIIWMGRGYMGLGLLMAVIFWAIWIDSDPFM